VIGVGRDTTELGRQLGVKMSLFDSTNPFRPVEAYNIVIGGEFARTEVDKSHHAFRCVYCLYSTVGALSRT